MNVFKVVRRRDDGTLISALAGNELQTLYRTDGATFPPNPNLPLLAFNDIIFARNFQGWISVARGFDLEVWEAEAEVAVDGIYLNLSPLSRIEDVLYRNRHAGHYAVKALTFPIGTVFCSSIELKRRLYGG